MKNDNQLSNYPIGTELYLYQKVGVFGDDIEKKFLGNGKIVVMKEQNVIAVNNKTADWSYGDENILTQERIKLREIKITTEPLELDEDGKPNF